MPRFQDELPQVISGKSTLSSTAVDYPIDLNRWLISAPTSTFLMRVASATMQKSGIYPGDIAVVDRSLTPVHRSLVVAAIEGELQLKYIYRHRGAYSLKASDPKSPALSLDQTKHREVWGVVTTIIRDVKPKKRRP